jgi:hypothetical protein
MEITTNEQKWYETHKTPFAVVLINLVGNLLPLIILMLFFTANWNRFYSWEPFYGEGQFYLSSASLLTTAAYLLYSLGIGKLRKLLLFLSLLLLFFISVLYAFKISGNNNKLVYILATSLGMFFLTTAIFYYATYLEKSPPPDPKKKETKDVKDIMDDL